MTVELGDEHDFSGTTEQWEERVFRAATLRGGAFRTYHREGHRREEFNTFTEALRTIIKEPDQAILYAVSPSGRAVSLPRVRWNAYARIWIDARGQEMETKLIPFRQAFPGVAIKRNMWCAYVHTKNSDDKHAVYGGIVYAQKNNGPQIKRVIMQGEFLKYEEAIRVFPELKQEEYRR